MSDMFPAIAPYFTRERTTFAILMNHKLVNGEVKINFLPVNLHL